jgi:hypothetical protein
MKVGDKVRAYASFLGVWMTGTITSFEHDDGTNVQVRIEHDTPFGIEFIGMKIWFLISAVEVME